MTSTNKKHGHLKCPKCEDDIKALIETLRYILHYDLYQHGFTNTELSTPHHINEMAKQALQKYNPEDFEDDMISTNKTLEDEVMGCLPVKQKSLPLGWSWDQAIDQTRKNLEELFNG